MCPSKHHRFLRDVPLWRGVVRILYGGRNVRRGQRGEKKARINFVGSFLCNKNGKISVRTA